jgi:voltage-gated potassium channel Kch
VFFYLGRRIGIKAFYGDATRHELLEPAGANHAKLLIVTLSDREKADALVKTARNNEGNSWGCNYFNGGEHSRRFWQNRPTSN